MKQISQIIFFGVCLIGSLAAQDTQSPPPGAPFGVLQQELILRGLDQHSPEVEREIAERKYARYLEQRFVAKMNRFVMLWRAFVEEYNTKREENRSTLHWDIVDINKFKKPGDDYVPSGERKQIGMQSDPFDFLLQLKVD